MFIGLRTIIYPAPDLEAAKRWYSELLGMAPYFDEPFYVGFNVGGYELGLDPDRSVQDGPGTYWGVADADAALQRLLSLGATERLGVREVGEGIRVASVRDPMGAEIGIIENPHFELTAITGASGPGR